MYPKQIAIVGCGSLGSFLSYHIVLKSLEQKINKLVLVDRDSLIHKNFPFIIGKDQLIECIGVPKVMALKHIFEDINPDLNIEIKHGSYPKIWNNDPDFYNIDCRDTVDEHSSFNLKLNIDGDFGLINFKPEDYISSKTSRYILGDSKYNSMLFSGLCTQVIFNEDYKDDISTYCVLINKNMELFNVPKSVKSKSKENSIT